MFKKKYVALKGNMSDDEFFNRLKSSEKSALDSVRNNYNFSNGDNVIIYEITFKPIKKGKVSVELTNES